MPMVDEKDTYTKGYLTPKKLDDGREYKFRALAYKKYEGGQYPDKEGFTAEYIFEPMDDDVKENFADDEGKVIFTCNAKGMKKEFFLKDVNEGDVITLKKTGEGFKTKYEIKKVDK